METIDVDVCIVGAGILGLAVAEEFAKAAPELAIVVLERHEKFGQEASSHNSEVIHAGIYYAPGSVKAATCTAGRDLLYEFCDREGVPYLKCGKFIVANDPDQANQLEKIRLNAAQNGVDLLPVPGSEASARLGLDIHAALWSPLSGVVDSHSMMQRLQDLAIGRGVHFLYGHHFERLNELSHEGSLFTVKDPNGEELQIRSRHFVNAGGLGAARIANQFTRENSGAKPWEVKACRGRYFFLSSEWTGKYRTLIYPLPDPRGGLGTHLTIDLSLRGRLGPDVDWPTGAVEADDWAHYKFDQDVDGLREQFFEAGRRFLPDLKLEHLSPDYVGVRAKLFKNGTAHPEFVIDSSQPGVVHCLGIESPGVTASLAIARECVNRLLVKMPETAGVTSAQACV